MVKFAILSAIAAFATAVLAVDIPPEMEWMIVDTHTAQPDCLTATNRKCDVIDLAEVTQRSVGYTHKMAGRIDNLRKYKKEQFLADCNCISEGWLTTSKMLNASLPLPAEKDFYQRMAAADMVHWTLHLPLFTQFKRLIDMKDEIPFDKKYVYQGIDAIRVNSDILAIDAFNYLPVDPPIIREQIGMLGAWLHEEFDNALKEFA